MFKVLKMVTPGAEPLLKALSEGKSVADVVTIVTGTTSATPGTRTSHAHGMNYTPTIVIVVPAGVNGDTADAASVPLVSVDATNITVKGSAASVNFTAYLM